MTMAGTPDGDCGQQLTWTAVQYENGATFEGFLDDERRRQTFGRLFDGKHTTHDCEYRDGVMHGRGRTVCVAAGKESEYIGGFDVGEKSGDGVFTCGDCCYVGPYSKGRRHGVGILKKGGSVLKQTWAKAHVTESAAASLVEEVAMFVVRRHDTLREVTKFLPKDMGPRFRSAEIGRTEGDSDNSVLRESFEAVVSVEEITLPSGSQYKGDVIGGNRYGVGEWSHPEGDRYVGEWRNNKKHGWGQYTAGGGQRQYDGEWVDDKMNGWGVSKQPDGVFVGTYTADSKSGAGVLFPASGGAPLLQQWEEGKMLNEAAALDDASKEYDAVKELIVSAVHKAAGLS